MGTERSPSALSPSCPKTSATRLRVRVRFTKRKAKYFHVRRWQTRNEETHQKHACPFEISTELQYRKNTDLPILEGLVLSLHFLTGLVHDKVLIVVLLLKCEPAKELSFLYYRSAGFINLTTDSLPLMVKARKNNNLILSVNWGADLSCKSYFISILR